VRHTGVLTNQATKQLATHRFSAWRRYRESPASGTGGIAMIFRAVAPGGTIAVKSGSPPGRFVSSVTFYGTLLQR
jgi:hypothetical protein